MVTKHLQYATSSAIGYGLIVISFILDKIAHELLGHKINDDWFLQEIVGYLSILKTSIRKHATPQERMYIRIMDTICIDGQTLKRKTNTIQRIQLFRIMDEDTNTNTTCYLTKYPSGQLVGNPSEHNFLLEISGDHFIDERQDYNIIFNEEDIRISQWKYRSSTKAQKNTSLYTLNFYDQQWVFSYNPYMYKIIGEKYITIHLECYLQKIPH